MMNIVIFGAAGTTGRLLVERALAEGYEVTAFDRQTAALTIQHPKLTLIQGDIFNPSQVEEAIAGQDVVISILGVRPGVTTPVCSIGSEHIIAAIQNRKPCLLTKCCRSKRSGRVNSTGSSCVLQG